MRQKEGEGRRSRLWAGLRSTCRVGTAPAGDYATVPVLHVFCVSATEGEKGQGGSEPVWRPHRCTAPAPSGRGLSHLTCEALAS